MNVLTFGGDYWDGPRHNRHYFLEELGRHERVLFVSPPFHLARLIERKVRSTRAACGESTTAWSTTRRRSGCSRTTDRRG